MRRGRPWSVLGIAPALLLSCAALPAVAHLPTTTGPARAVALPVRLSDLSCPTSLVCVAYGSDATGAPVMFRTTDGAAAWTQESLAPSTPDGYPKEGLSCSTASQCLGYATGELDGIASVLYTAFIETTDGGATWTTRPVDNFGGSNVSDPTCAAPRDCYAIKNLSSVIRSTDGGASWKAVPGSGWPSPTCGGCSSAGLDDLSCPHASTICFVVAQDATNAFEFGRTSQGGARLDRIAHLPGVRGRGGYLVSCGSARACLVVNAFSTKVLTTSDAGTRWVARSLPAAVDAVHALSCPSVSVCVALVHERTHNGQLLAATTRDDGASWTVVAVSSAPAPLWTASLSCPSASDCYVAGPAAAPSGSVYARTGASTRWVRTAVT